MAPLRQPPSRSAQPVKSILKQSAHGVTPNAADSLFPSSKKDRRRIKHAQLLNKVTKSAERKPRRRRPSKKLVTTLDALAGALPDGEEGEAIGDMRAAAGEKAQDQVNIIKRKSMKSRPGAMKRRENLDKGERERFAKNMAQLAVPRPVSEVVEEENSSSGINTTSKTAAISSTSERWAALRGFISQTLETKPELKGVKT